MAWVKVDDGFVEHPKVLAAARALGGKNAIGRIVHVWLEGANYCARRLTDGVVPLEIAERMMTDDKPIEVWKAMCAAKLAHAEDTGAFRFHDWTDYQPSAKVVKEKRARDRYRKAQA
jgi:hypothetical protein